MSEAAADMSFEDLREGDEFEEPYAIVPAAYEAFVAASGDRSPLHVDDDYARARGFPERVMHGALLNAFVSHFVGMRVPGRRALLQAMDLQYLKPSFLGDRLILRATVAQKVEAARAIVLHVKIQNETRQAVVARGRVQVGIAP
jgi:3-hydroxybutyryl-CoA dehydratase